MSVDCEPFVSMSTCTIFHRPATAFSWSSGSQNSLLCSVLAADYCLRSSESTVCLFCLSVAHSRSPIFHVSALRKTATKKQFLIHCTNQFAGNPCQHFFFLGFLLPTVLVLAGLIHMDMHPNLRLAHSLSHVSTDQKCFS